MSYEAKMWRYVKSKNPEGNVKIQTLDANLDNASWNNHGNYQYNQGQYEAPQK